MTAQPEFDWGYGRLPGETAIPPTDQAPPAFLAAEHLANEDWTAEPDGLADLAPEWRCRNLQRRLMRGETELYLGGEPYDPDRLALWRDLDLRYRHLAGQIAEPPLADDLAGQP